MTGTITRRHGGDRHMDEADGMASGDRLAAIVVEANERIGDAIAMGRDIHAIGAWPGHGIGGKQLGPHKNGWRPS